MPSIRYSRNKRFCLVMDTGNCQHLIDELDGLTEKGWTIVNSWATGTVVQVLLRAPAKEGQPTQALTA